MLRPDSITVEKFKSNGSRQNSLNLRVFATATDSGECTAVTSREFCELPQVEKAKVKGIEKSNQQEIQIEQSAGAMTQSGSEQQPQIIDSEGSSYSGAIFQLQLDARMSNSLPIVQIVKILDWERLQEMSWNTWVRFKDLATRKLTECNLLVLDSSIR